MTTILHRVTWRVLLKWEEVAGGQYIGQERHERGWGDRQWQIIQVLVGAAKECGFYLNCIRLPPTRSLPRCLRNLSMPSFVPLWILRRNLIWQHPGNFIVSFSIYVKLVSPQGQGLYLFMSVFPGPSTPLSIEWVLHVYWKSEWGIWKWVPSDLFSSSLILFLAMSHLPFNPSLEVFILTIMFSFRKYLHYGFIF